jgi:hypothetical protein
MKIRYIFLIFGVVFFITLAIIVGQRLSSEAMAVMVGVVAGVAASIPTSLIVVWVATHFSAQQAPPPTPPPAPERERVIVMTHPNQQANYSPYPQNNPTGVPYPAYPAVAAPSQPRKFTVIGGAESAIETPAEVETEGEVLWQR